MENTPDKILLAKPYVSEEAIQSAVKVLRSGWLAHGEYVTRFESDFAKYIGTKHAVSLNSCTSALELVIQALGIKGEVIVPSFTFVASANAIVTSGAKPVFIDVEYTTCNMDVSLLASLITKNTEAIMPVHFGGQSCKMDVIMTLAKKHSLAVIEDSAETIGGTYKGKMTGSFGVGCFSFFPTKNMTTAEGGMITTNDAALADKIAILHAHGIKKDKSRPAWQRNAVTAGYNYRLNNVLAAIGVEHLKDLDLQNKKRQDLAERYNSLLKNIKGIELPVKTDDASHVYQMYTIKLVRSKVKRDDVIKGLIERGIEASVHFDPPVHKQTFYRKAGFRSSGLHTTEKLSQEMISLPMHPMLTTRDIDRVAGALEEILQS